MFIYGVYTVSAYLAVSFVFIYLAVKFLPWLSLTLTLTLLYLGNKLSGKKNCRAYIYIDTVLFICYFQRHITRIYQGYFSKGCSKQNLFVLLFTSFPQFIQDIIYIYIYLIFSNFHTIFREGGLSAQAHLAAASLCSSHGTFQRYLGYA